MRARPEADFQTFPQHGRSHAQLLTEVGPAFARPDLDERPIIEQDTVRITHAQSSEDYVSLGRDVVAQVLVRAIHAHARRRAFPNGSKIVVFPASPGSYSSERMG